MTLTLFLTLNLTLKLNVKALRHCTVPNTDSRLEPVTSESLVRDLTTAPPSRDKYTENKCKPYLLLDCGIVRTWRSLCGSKTGPRQPASTYCILDI